MNKQELFQAIEKGVKKSGVQLAYSALLMYYAFFRKETPSWARSIITGAMAYLICPVDAIPDVTPIVGYTDDIGVLSFALVSVAAYINQDIREKAKNKLRCFCKNYNPKDLEEVDEKL
jgi:uncharacterized membrane protein YkvA (DUF1232 family)